MFMGFLGTHSLKLDDKGRFFVPAKYRDQLTEGLVITRGHEKSLIIYPAEAFQAQAMKILSKETGLARVRAERRMFASAASDETPDKQGRLTIPPALREYAKLDRDIVVTGNLDSFEVWDAAAWQDYADSEEDDYAAMDTDFRTPTPPTEPVR